jgi:DNA-binding transcriptional regulator YhcF (GntR family)
MNRHRKDLNRNRQQRFVQLLHWEMDCVAYKDLSANARSIYEQIKRRYNGSNNGFIVYSVRQAADELKIGKATASRAFSQLEDHWFIVAEQRGHFSWKINPNGSKIRPATEWRLTVYDNNRTAKVTEQGASKDFMRWQKIQNAVSPEVRLVPVAKPYGPSSETMRSKNRLNGTRGGTIRGVRTG